MFITEKAKNTVCPESTKNDFKANSNKTNNCLSSSIFLFVNSDYEKHQIVKKKKFSNWVKKIIQQGTSGSSSSGKKSKKGFENKRKVNQKENLVFKKANISGLTFEASCSVSNSLVSIESTHDKISVCDNISDEYCSDNFSVQGMRSLAQGKVGRPQGISINKIDELNDQDIVFTKKYRAQRDSITDTALSFEKFETEPKILFTTPCVKKHGIYKNTNQITCIKDYQSNSNNDLGCDSAQPSEFLLSKSENSSVFSDGLPSVDICQQTISSSLMGIPPQSIIENTRYYNTASINSYRLPATTMSIASQSIKNYKPFTKASNLNINELQPGASIFSGVGTTTSRYNYYYNISDESDEIADYEEIAHDDFDVLSSGELLTNL
ncbi:hypothetical protein QEN19_004145 [Hanseniaspora menglaensis]